MTRTSTFMFKTDGGSKVWFCRADDRRPPELRWRVLDEATVGDMTLDDFRTLHFELQETLHALSREAFAFVMADCCMTKALHETFVRVLEGRDG